MSDPKDQNLEIEDLDSSEENPTGGRSWRGSFGRVESGPNDGCMGNPQYPCNPDPDPDPGPNDDCMGNPQYPCGDGGSRPVKGFKF